MRIKEALVCGFLLTTISSGIASQVVFQRIEEMIGSVNVIILATVQSAEKVLGTNRQQYSLEVNEVIAGEITAKQITVTYYEQGSASFSVIVPASGIEHQLRRGKRYFFLFKSIAEQKGLGIVLTRAEPEERRNLVVSAWKKIQPSEK